MVSESEMTAPPEPEPEHKRCERCGERGESVRPTVLGLYMCDECYWNVPELTEDE